MSNNQLEEVDDDSQLLCLVIHSSLDGYLVHDLVINFYRICLTLITFDNIKLISLVINFIIIEDHVKVLHMHNIVSFHPSSLFLYKTYIIFHRDLAVTLKTFKIIVYLFILRITTCLFPVLDLIILFRRMSKHKA